LNWSDARRLVCLCGRVSDVIGMEERDWLE